MTNQRIGRAGHGRAGPSMPRRLGFVTAALLFALAGGIVPARAAGPAQLTIVVFTMPSLGGFLPKVIKQRRLDAANGLDIDFAERTPDAYTAQFNSGEFALGGSAALLTVGLADARGIGVSYLFNLFDYWGAVVTQRPGITTLADLKGKELAAAKGTTNYVMFEWFARAQGLDPALLRVINTATPGLIGYALADRADAVQLWEPAYALLLARRPGIRTLDLGIARLWRAFAGTDHIPYLGVAAHQDWIAAHRPLIAPLYHTYRAAAEWVAAHPQEAAPLIAGSAAGPADRTALAQLISDKNRLGMNVAPAARLAPDIDAVYRAGLELGFLPKMPAPATIFPEPIE